MVNLVNVPLMKLSTFLNDKDFQDTYLRKNIACMNHEMLGENQRELKYRQCGDGSKCREL